MTENPVTCHKCSYSWDYGGSSEARYIYCPRCRANVPNPNSKNPKGE